MLSDLLDLVGIYKGASDAALKGHPAAKKNLGMSANMLSKAQSISAKAKKYIMQYPVACSDSITDITVATSIAKQVEFDCARFYLLASGLNPILSTKNKDTIEAHLDRLSTLSEESLGMPCKISVATDEDIAMATEQLKYFNSPYEFVNSTTLNRTVYSKEMKETDVEKDTADKDPVDNTFGNPMNSSGNVPSTNSAGSDVGTNIVTARMDGSDRSQIMTKLGKLAPTVIKIDLVLDNAVGRPISIPLAFKSDIQYVNSEDIKDLIAYVDSPNKKLQNFIRWTTGEISLLKDVWLAWDSIHRDTERIRTLGQVPIWRKLMFAKDIHKIKTIRDNIPNIPGLNLFKKVVQNVIAKKTQKDLPMVTLALTVSDFEDASNVSVIKALAGHNKILDQLMDTYMLLGICIVDEPGETIYFKYSGEDWYTTTHISKVGSQAREKDIGTDMVNILRTMTRNIGQR